VQQPAAPVIDLIDLVDEHQIRTRKSARRCRSARLPIVVVDGFTNARKTGAKKWF
jgi:hypothetical protein